MTILGIKLIANEDVLHETGCAARWRSLHHPTAVGEGRPGLAFDENQAEREGDLGVDCGGYAKDQAVQGRALLGRPWRKLRTEEGGAQVRVAIYARVSTD